MSFLKAGEKPFQRGARNVWAPKLGEAGLVAFLTHKEAIYLHDVHWDPVQRRSFPCDGTGDCEACTRQSPIQKAYACVLLYRGYLTRTESGWQVPDVSTQYMSSLWHPRTLEITRSIADLVEVAKPGALAWIERSGNRCNAPCKAKSLCKVLKVPEGLEWDVRTSCLRAWQAR